MNHLVIATGNAHKVSEYQALFPDVPLVALSSYGPAPEVIEDAPDFVGNAILKARAAYEQTGQPSLADDSGLEVMALDDRPGVLSARYVPGSDQDRYNALLKELGDRQDRRARFVCAIAIAGLPDTEFTRSFDRVSGCIVATGFFNGSIAHEAKGDHGFGYDPIFAIEDGRCVAQLSPSEKHAISHRGHAAEQVASLLSQCFKAANS